MKVRHVAVACSSQENADRFYGGILGLEKMKSSTLTGELAKQIFDTPHGCQFVLYAGEEIAFEVFLPEKMPEKAVPYVHTCLEVEDRNNFIRRCGQSGCVVKRVKKNDSEIIFLSDYDGNLFEVKQS
ncbi:MAG: hypothetical protein JRI79_04050 [Deltaproteobacteria bacterium]|nr:hypothetical protein [Deltaproteobacteria bacterium]MBW1920746.1 hypothetical protein [Deltaproteobacteria bacterium]MBW1937010.1 hypothetical protein [Deltaproteobacteria bacterium]MBW1977132.1 hypothetical protein [Deltaproteobacteria bacterium]MBW2043577.1 hypothetical protein [Deltaproteobacteria bacterium]